MAVDKGVIAEALNYLVEAQNYSRIINEMTQIIEQWDDHPMAYSGKLTPLNALLEVGLTNRSAFERLLKLVEERRRAVPQIKRTDYQRMLMRQRRARVARAIELAELTSGIKMDTAQRKEHEKGLQQRWGVARDEFIKARGKLDWKGRNEAAQAFWQTIDRQLAVNLAAARKEKLK